MPRTAMILAAGLGTRLRPLTDKKPKALIVYDKKPLLQHVIEKLTECGFKRIIINIHHLGDMIIDFLRSNNNFNTEIIISDERNALLNTGGAVLKASKFFGEGPVLVHNVDIITDLDLQNLYESHLRKDGLATLAVKKRKTSRSLLMDENHLLCGWRNNETGQEIIARKKSPLYPIAFSAIYVINKELPRYFQHVGAFPVMPELLDIAGKQDLWLYEHIGEWKDMGKPQKGLS